MIRSTERFLTTQVGSLARPRELIELSRAKEGRQPYDRDEYVRQAREAVSDVVRMQVEYGIDVVGDGEQAKSSFANYVSDRLGGFELRQAAGPGGGPWAGSREELDFPGYYERLRNNVPGLPQMICTGPITYQGHDAVQFDIENLRAAIENQPVTEAFLTAISTTNVEGQRRNEYYATDEEFLQAIADAMHEEYAAIVDAGFLLQVDDPRLSTYYVQHPELSVEDCRKWAASRIEVLNYALRGIPEDRVRFHTCYSIDIGPRVHDMDLEHIVDLMLTINAGAYSFEASNPRHEHEYRVWERVTLPEGKVLIPGVVSHTTNLVEHPDLVAERTLRFARIVGPENVIAGADCGFAAIARFEPDIHPEVARAKLRALGEGARRASKQLRA